MKHIVLFSGGIQSAYVAYLLLQEKNKKDIILLFCDTKSEHPDTYRFINDVSKYLDFPITVVQNGMNIWELCDYKKMIPNPINARFCTVFLKIKPAEEFYKNLNEDFIIYIGYGMNEYRRMQKITARNPNKKYEFPLFKLNITKNDIKNIIKREWKICLPEMYIWFKHANCLPCFLMGLKEWKTIYKHFENEFRKAMEYEDIYNYHILSQGFLKDLIPIFEDKSQLNLFDEVDIIPCLCSV